jgi:hypothetical protein
MTGRATEKRRTDGDEATIRRSMQQGSACAGSVLPSFQAWHSRTSPVPGMRSRRYWYQEQRVVLSSLKGRPAAEPRRYHEGGCDEAARLS